MQKITNQQIIDLAAQLKIAVVRMAPSWRWFIKQLDGTKTVLGQRNEDAWEALQKMIPKKVQKPKKLRFWVGNGLGLFKDSTAPEDCIVHACATSRAALVRKIHDLRGYQSPSIAYRVKTHWQEVEFDKKWPVPAEEGVWVQLPGEKAHKKFGV